MFQNSNNFDYNCQTPNGRVQRQGCGDPPMHPRCNPRLGVPVTSAEIARGYGGDTSQSHHKPQRFTLGTLYPPGRGVNRNWPGAVTGSRSVGAIQAMAAVRGLVYSGVLQPSALRLRNSPAELPGGV